MKSRKKGTTLIEVLLYLIVSMCIFMGTMKVTMNVYTTSKEHVRRQDDLMQLACTLAYLVHDIQEASAEMFHIRALSKDSLIMRLKGSDCGWFVKKGQLIRYTGTYDHQAQSWSHRSASMIAGTVSVFTVMCHRKEDIIDGVTCMVRGAHIELEQFVATGGS